MTLIEAMGLLGSFLGFVAGVVTGAVLGLGWWTIGTVILGFFVGWLVGCAFSPLVLRWSERLWERERQTKKDQAEQGGGHVR